MVSYRVSGGTATPGEDYETGTNGVLVFSYADPNSRDAFTNRVQSIPIVIKAVGQAKPDETVVVTLFNPVVVPSITTNEVVVDEGGMSVTNEVVVITGTPGFLDTYEHHVLT